MPRFLVVGHVSFDRFQGQVVPGGTASYAALAAHALGWEAAALTCAGPDFDPARELPGVRVFLRRSPVTSRFETAYDADGARAQVLSARADDVDLTPLPEEWRRPDVLLLGPVANEVPGGLALAFEAGLVGAAAQGWLRTVDLDGRIEPREWRDPGHDLAGVHALFLSEQDLPQAGARAADFLAYVPLVALTRGWEGLRLFTREAVHEVPALPREEVDPTGAGDVFAAAFLLRYHETGEALAAAAFGACAASCVVEGIGPSAFGDRAEVERRLRLRDRLIEEGDWDE